MGKTGYRQGGNASHAAMDAGYKPRSRAQ